MKTVGITGATGFVGGALVRAFVRDGADVVAFVRDPARASLSVDVRMRPYDLDGGPPDLSGIDTLIHCAYAPSAGPSDDRVTLNVDAAAVLFRAARAHGARFVFMSSVNAGTAIASAYARQKRAIEADLGHEALILRPGLIAGAGGVFANLLAAAQRPVVPLIDGGRQTVQLIGLDDLYAALRVALDAGLSGVHTVVNEPPVTMRAIVETVGGRGGRAPLLVPVPGSLALAIASLAERAGVPLPVTTENIRGLRGLATQPPSAALLDAGWRPRSTSAVLASVAANASS